MTNLKKFIQEKMKMSHIYQPVMIKTLLENGGQTSKRTIAQAILNYDFSQVEYYENISNNMVGRVLRSHDIVSKEKDEYLLSDYESLSESEIQEIIELCDDKIQEYIDNRGKKIWEHRRRNRKPVPGSIRYKVLSRAKGRCELCGISAEEKALEVDHIIPKNLGGEDSINNYQALCYTCNANKRDTDSTDFRGINKIYSERKKDCLFCKIDKSRIIAQNNLAYLIADQYPVTEMHSLVIPKRHCETYFDLTQAELNAINTLIQERREYILQSDSSVTGFNIGINNGEDAGQTIFHCHVHLIPRRKGDVENPVGGVRNVIPGMGKYLSK
jgi:diadenosine tetraphosphate (Ap4A) HIT family hydrolase